MNNNGLITPDGALFWIESFGASGITVGEIALTPHVSTHSEFWAAPEVVTFTYPRI